MEIYNMGLTTKCIKELYDDDAINQMETEERTLQMKNRTIQDRPGSPTRICFVFIIVQYLLWPLMQRSPKWNRRWINSKWHIHKYTDNTIPTAENAEGLTYLINRITSISEENGMRLNTRKTAMIISKINVHQPSII